MTRAALTLTVFITLRLSVNKAVENRRVGNAGLVGYGFESLLNHFGVCTLMLSRMGHEIICDGVSEYSHSTTHRFIQGYMLEYFPIYSLDLNPTEH
ncbi:hypothetical protein [Symbiopectobacterium purcellii]|uniref:hypothetical protein n=1 Tax=Symbiopectobacterium purcellii TaxID=2871826 RepID=UPI003F82F61A